MELRSLLGKKVEKSFLHLSVLLFGLSVLLSLTIYLGKAIDYYKSNLPVLEEAVGRIHRLKSFVSYAEGLRPGDGDYLTFARILDSARSVLRDPQIAISEPKVIENMKSVSLSIKGDARFGEIVQILKLLEEERSPIFLVKSLSMKKKEGVIITYEISSEVYLVK